MTEFENIGRLSKTTACIADTYIGRIDVDFAACALCRLSCSQAEKARFNFLAVLIELIQREMSPVLRNGPSATKHDDHDGDQKLKKRES